MAKFVATTAKTMPMMPNTLPFRAVSCFDSPASARMNISPAAM